MRLPSHLSSLRVQLGIAIVAVAALTLALAFVAVYRATRANTRSRIDHELMGQVAEWREFSGGKDLRTPKAVERVARGFITSQTYHPESRIFVIEVSGAGPVTNHPAIVTAERAREDRGDEAHEGKGDGLLDSPPGLTTVEAEQAGRLRVETHPIVRAGRTIATLRVADPLSTFDRDQEGLQRNFVIVGLVAVVLALVVAIGMAVLIAAPLRRITRVAADVDAGDLDHRVHMDGRGEIASLGRTFDRMLDRLTHAFGRQREFVSDASHELRTPLAVMKAQVELLRDETDERAREEGLRTLLRHLDAMDRLVADLLTLAGVDSSRLIEPEWIDLSLLLQDTARDLPLFGARDYRVEEAHGFVYADLDRITQVLRNLIRNAVNHTRDGDAIGVEVEVRGDEVEFAVSDTGPGIQQDQLERIFERFHRTDASRARDRGGSGLGLPIARVLVEAHGGRIWAESETGKGATVRFTIPGYRRTRGPSPPVVRDADGDGGLRRAPLSPPAGPARRV
jgi:two-component system, OmpR family, sensor kinase